MPYTTSYTIAGFGTVLAGLLFKLRIGEALSLTQYAILSLALFIWGLIAFALLHHLLPTHSNGDGTIAILSIPLGVGMSELFATSIAVLKMIIEDIPDEVKKFLESKIGGGK